MRTASRFAIVIVVLVVVLGGIFGYTFYRFGKMQEQMSQPQPPAVIEATTAQRTSWIQAIKAVGSITAINGVEVANEVAGVVESVGFDSGDRVEKGDILLRMDTSTDEAALRTQRAEAQLAVQQFNRTSDLLPKRAVSQAQYDEAKANMEAARARVNEAEAQLQKKIIKAPFDGTLGLRLVDQGQYLAVGTPIVEINMLDPIYVDYTISEKELINVDVGHDVVATVAALPDEEFRGKVSAINSSVNPQTRTVRIRATLKNPEQALRPGMFATIQTVRPQERDVVTLPRTAISFNTYGDFVYVLKEKDDGQLVTERRSVETGGTRSGRVEVTNNLEAGEQVVATGLLRLRSGQPVEIKSEGNKNGSPDQQQSGESSGGEASN
ncbi:MexH family multidrug efflux RND transporter periplasmic adaptor subunit [Marinobacter nanhaiticus D15-8W]|uniref:Efflux RND transporter periplasmic adaptor subunit n=1 Tax=Marinobacter nanhaiticus D15-8W TaxID=626887 RepID=N6WWU0_9GAMM|nr:efflux RND transporter periplasmic adaptor subunit [Marinobacter nanhaiticus]ENO16081.1 efflux RND transporter periplasmic adaptor subunit [Marinobacter nanhaiticus D15-8W]BES73062.1 MexH family multidrug efflux RND transporter periplasmic adaptor subunit [Marinobacter nanhaiticus D15-8W]